MYLWLGSRSQGQGTSPWKGASDELAVGAEGLQHLSPGAGHDHHVDDDIGRICHFDADLGEGRAYRSHGERDDVHRPPFHASPEDFDHLALHVGGRGPVVRWADVLLVLGADVGTLFDTRNVARVRAGEIAFRAKLFVQLGERAVLHEEFAHLLVVFRRAIAGIDAVGLT
jgi:hypothetical protein